ncbi:MAG: FAD-binding oxidoreductase, partial [bacterium]|nr:FAD-binding oxidoreductase [bacterium]
MGALKTNDSTGRVDQSPPDSLIDGLIRIAGKDHVGSGPDAAKALMPAGRQASGKIVVSVQNVEALQSVIKLAGKHKMPVMTCNDRYLLEEDVDRKAILIDFSLMNQIERIDNRNLVGHIQRGVTWDQLNEHLKKLGVKTTAPVAASSPYPLECIVARTVGKAITKFPDYALMNMLVVRANGNIHKTGNHGLNEEAADGRNEGSCNLSQWYVGGDDIFGIVARASIMIYPIPAARSCLIYGFEDRDELLKALKEVPRTELGVEYLGLNRATMHRLLGGERSSFPAWSLVIGFEGRKRLVAHNEDRVNRILNSYECQPISDHVQPMAAMLDEPWMAASENHSAFYALFSKMAGLEKCIDKAADHAGLAEENLGKIFVSVDRGRCVYAVYDWLDKGDHSDAMNQMNLALAEEGAFFDRPHGALGRKVYSGIPNHLPVLKHIKHFMDPDNVLNPGRIIRAEDPQWQAPQVQEGESGLTIENLKAVKEKLINILGADWVTDNPVDLSAYGRDFTIFSGERPNLLVMPSTTEEIQQIMRVAYSHGIPVIPQTTGFNHGGLTVSRKGGLLIDLRRMDDICSVDVEAMTVSVSPFVRMRSVWWEVVKHQIFEGIHLKPILPLTFASISLLSNYVARGAPGTTAKHGMATELTTHMTWVLPNGEILKIGPGAVPGVGNLPLHYCPGPEINGMFFNADGMFGICTELTAKLYPEYDNANEREDMIIANIMEPDEHLAFLKIIDSIYDISRENITEFMYKGHPGPFALGLEAKMPGMKIKDL